MSRIEDDLDLVRADVGSSSRLDDKVLVVVVCLCDFEPVRKGDSRWATIVILDIVDWECSSGWAATIIQEALGKGTVSCSI